MKQILEHINVSVSSLSPTEVFLTSAFPDFQRRGGGFAPGYGPWIHVGNEQFYVSLTEVPQRQAGGGFGHAGFVVEDLDALMERLSQAGYQPSLDTALNSHPWRRRIYYEDGNGLEWEFVQYLSDDVAQRNDYSH